MVGPKFDPKNGQIMRIILSNSKKSMACERKCNQFYVTTKDFYYYDCNSHKRGGLISNTDCVKRKI